jgi:hypothetical protein
MGSAVYQQASRGAGLDQSRSDLAKSLDAPRVSGNTDFVMKDCFAQFPRRRLSAEEIRDSILFVSGELDLSPGRGHPFPPATTWGYTQHNPFYGAYEHNKRSVYLMTQRIRRHPFLALFDGADPNTSTPERRPTTVPTQALFFMNDPVVHEKAEKFAARLLAAGGDEAHRIERAYRLALGRVPTLIESADAREFLAAYRSALNEDGKEKTESEPWAAFARVLFGSSEFLTID